MAETDIAGFWQQAYWNNLDTGSGTDLVLTNSSGQVGPVTITFTANATWGSGTGTDSADQRMLNGLIEDNGTITFNNVPAGNHALIAYAVTRPLTFPNLDLTAGGTTIYGRQMNSDEYNPAPGFYSMSSTSAANRSVGNMARFDGLTPVDGQITLAFTGATDCGINGLQLVLNAPNPGAPPSITQQPVSANVLEGRRAMLSVQVTGAEPLSFQWRRHGRTLFDDGRISGVNTATLTITGFTAADVARYDVAIANPAGTVISSAAALNLYTGDITERLVGHWKFDETDGLTAANAAGGSAGVLTDFGWANWDAGKIGNALNYDFSGWVLVDDYPKASQALAVSAWVKLGLEPTTDAGAPILRNWGSSAGQFNLAYTGVDPSQLQAQVRIGPNNVTAATPAADANPTEWTHIAMSADGARLTLYVNGVAAASTDYIGNISAPPMPWLAFGTEMDDTGVPLATAAKLFGATDDVGLWTRALSADEVAAIYQAGLQGKDLSTVEIVIPEEPEIAIEVDGSGNAVINFIGTLIHSPTVNGPYTPVDGATSPYTTSEPGFYQTME
ncbi:MAG: immunoglobulin domain-containing protein [Verrucomicrobiae bacterium]|nr:immunoglobulin domain-containing protein [Verrucomicrobiae bacterium]